MGETYYTLVFIKTMKKLLLGFKKRGFGKGTWNGYGGKLEENEDAVDCAVRELHEESNLKVSPEDLKYLGVVLYHDVCANVQKRIVHIFTVGKISGDLRETDEMKPKWFDFENIPYKDMWPDSKYWLPLVLKNHWLHANFTYNNDRRIVHNDVKKLEIAPSSATNVQNYTCSYQDPTHKQYKQQNLAIHVQNN